MFIQRSRNSIGGERKKLTEKKKQTFEMIAEHKLDYRNDTCVF